MRHATHQDLFHNFNSLSKDLDPTHLYQTSMDGPNVNMKFFRSFRSTTKNVASIHWSTLVAVAWILFMEVFHEEKQNQGGPWKNFERCLLCSSQFTSKQRRLRKCYRFQFIPIKFLLNSVILCLFSWSFDDMYLRKKFFVNIFKNWFCCMYFLNKVVKFWLPFSSHKICKKNLISHLHFFYKNQVKSAQPRLFLTFCQFQP